jgi:glucan phosphoethanolaminetransferase (alkaline phosphatase superfamily)
MLLTSMKMSLSVNVLIIHPLLVCAAYTLILYALPSRLKIYAVTLWTVFLCLLYFTNIVAIQYWNEYISWSFLSINQEVIVEELKKFPVYFIPAIIIFVYLIYIAYRSLLAPTALKTNDFGVLLITPFLGIGFAYSSWIISEDMDIIWQGEPFYEFINTRSTGAQIQQEIIVSPSKNRVDNAGSPLPNIVLIHGDALRADRLSAYGNLRKTSPFIDGIVDTGAKRIPFGISNCSESICGFSSVLTSSFSFYTAPTGLFEILSQQGYVNNFIGAGSLYHAGLDKYIRPRVDNFLRADLDANYYMHDDRYVLDMLDKYPNYVGTPNLFYLRMMSSHGLGSHQQKYKKYEPTRDSLLFMLGGESQRQALINDHDNRASQFDDYVETIFSSLGKKGYLDNAIVVIFGDHGDALGERGNYGHYQTLYQEEVHVPIIFWSSSNIQMTIDTHFFATLMDIPATLLYQLKQPIPDFFMGSPLQQARVEKFGFLDSRKDTIGLVYQDAHQLLKLIIGRNDLSQAELYDLRNDPGERTNLYRLQPELVKMMAEERISVIESPPESQLNSGLD